MPEPQNGGFTGITGTDGPDATALSIFASSFQSEFSQTAGGPFTANPFQSSESTTTTTSPPQTSSEATSTTATSVTPSSTFVTSVSTNPGEPATLTSTGASNTAANAASNTSGTVTVSENACHSVSCSAALKAAVAVPIVVAALLAVFLCFFCARRRRKRADVVSEKGPKKPGKKWSRHLRAFSFDAELLMGGRFSSSNSMGSREPSVRSAGNNSRTSARSAEPSLHSIEEVAPPYRDAVAHVTPPGAAQPHSPAVAAVAAAGADPIPRPDSAATAPPPYGSIDGETAATPASASNPFADSAPVSPIEGSPFNDPPDEDDAATNGPSRGSSLRRSVMAAGASPTESEAGSVREAQIGRRVSGVSVRKTGISS